MKNEFDYNIYVEDGKLNIGIKSDKEFLGSTKEDDSEKYFRYFTVNERESSITEVGDVNYLWSEKDKGWDVSVNKGTIYHYSLDTKPDLSDISLEDLPFNPEEEKEKELSWFVFRVLKKDRDPNRDIDYYQYYIEPKESYEEHDEYEDRDLDYGDDGLMSYFTESDAQNAVMEEEKNSSPEKDKVKEYPERKTVVNYYEESEEGPYTATSHFGFDSTKREDINYFLNIYDEWRDKRLTTEESYQKAKKILFKDQVLAKADESICAYKQFAEKLEKLANTGDLKKSESFIQDIITNHGKSVLEMKPSEMIESAEALLLTINKYVE